MRGAVVRRVGGGRVGRWVDWGLRVHLGNRLHRWLEGGAGSPGLHVLLLCGLLLLPGVSEAVALPSARVRPFFRVGPGIGRLPHLSVAHVRWLAHVLGVMAGLALA